MWRKVEQNDGCLPSFLDSSVQNNFDLVGFFSICCNTPTVEACMQKSHLPVQHNRQSKTEAKQKVTQEPQKTKRTLLQHKQACGFEMHSFTQAVPVFFVLFFLISKVEQPPRVWFEKIKIKKQQCNACSFSGWQLWLIPNVCLQPT